MNSLVQNSQEEASLSKKPLEYVVLGFLELGPAYGYQIYDRMVLEIGTVWRIGRSQLYSLLAKLERKGFLTRDRIEQDNLPAKNIFTITEKGISAFEQWRDSPVDNVRQLRLEFLTKLFFAQIKGSHFAMSLLHQQLAVCQKKERLLETIRSSRSNQIECQAVDYRIEMIEASKRWISKMLRDLST